MTEPIQTWECWSPDRSLQAKLIWDPSAASSRLSYSVTLTIPDRDEIVLESSPLGIQRDDCLFENVSPVQHDETQGTDSFMCIHGKSRYCRAEYRECRVRFETLVHQHLELHLRVMNDAVAIRYHCPDISGSDHTFLNEMTGFAFPKGTIGFLQPHDAPGWTTPAYETVHQEVAAGTPAPSDMGWSFPALFKLYDGRVWVLLSEASLDETYCAARLAAESPDRTYHIRFPDSAEGNGVGEVTPRSSLPWTSPWRVIMVGTRPGSILESNAITHLSPPRRVAPHDWIKPGCVSWSWWSDQNSPVQFDVQKQVVDFAVEMRWPYTLVDAHWDEMGEDRIRELVAYADERGVGILLWYNSGGRHNSMPEKPRDRMHERGVRRREFRFLCELGVKGIKIDFFHSDKQDRIAQYLDILRDAAEFKLMISFHGCTIPRGWCRTYPHLMTMEGVKGAEWYIASEDFPAQAPRHHTLLPFTRNAVGPMDYTPVALSDNRYPRLTTDAHELALAVLFQSGWQHFADHPDRYRQLPESVLNLLKGLPASWDETRCLESDPGHYVVLARRIGSIWYVAGVNGQDQPMQLNLTLPLMETPGTLTLVSDDEQPRSLRVETLSSNAPVAVSLAPFGGCLAQWRPEESL